MIRNKHFPLAVCVLFLVLTVTVPTQAAVLSTDTITITDPSSLGSISLTSTVYDNFGGDFTKWLFEYDVNNISYDPFPGSGLPGSGTTNGLSGYQIVFPLDILSLADQFAPAGWFLNCCGVTPPFGAEADIDNSAGLGLTIGDSGLFGFTTPAFTPFSNAYEGSWAHSWIDNGQAFIFDQRSDADSDIGPIVPTGAPIPEPSTLLLFGIGVLGILCLGWQRHKKTA